MAQAILAPLSALDHPRGEPEGIADARTRKAAARFREFMEALGLDMQDPNLVGTDRRVARAFREIFAGHYATAEPALRTFPNTEGYAETVAVTDISFHSLCAHHFLPFFGTAHVAYVPKERLLGLSKLARVVEFYARRPQLQERMTEQIADLVEKRLRPAGTMVVIRARHLCMEMRGVGKAGLTTTTSARRGVFASEPSGQAPIGAAGGFLAQIGSR
jgi:GTP cyclohydrolase I